MKKILTIISILIFSTSAYANNRLNGFNKWLFENGHTEYVEKGESELCKDEPIGSVVWYYNNCDQPNYKNNLNSVTKINDYNNRSEIPEDVKPNFDTLLFYYWKYTNRNWNNNPKYTDIKASENPYKFESNLREDKYVKKQMQKTALLSYLFMKMEKLLLMK